MITNFEKETDRLTDKELNIFVPVIVEMLMYTKKETAKTNKHIRHYLYERGHKTTDIRIRKMINYIRLNGLVTKLIASSKGYYRSFDREEISDYLISLRQREKAIRAVREAISRQAVIGVPLELF